MNQQVIEKPPLGLRPRFVVDEERFFEIMAACARFRKAKRPIPKYWLEEAQEIANRLDKV